MKTELVSTLSEFVSEVSIQQKQSKPAKILISQKISSFINTGSI